jgi:hypothetical protein
MLRRLRGGLALAVATIALAFPAHAARTIQMDVPLTFEQWAGKTARVSEFALGPDGAETKTSIWFLLYAEETPWYRGTAIWQSNLPLYIFCTDLKRRYPTVERFYGWVITNSMLPARGETISMPPRAFAVYDSGTPPECKWR